MERHLARDRARTCQLGSMAQPRWEKTATVCIGLDRRDPQRDLLLLWDLEIGPFNAILGAKKQLVTLPHTTHYPLQRSGEAADSCQTRHAHTADRSSRYAQSDSAWHKTSPGSS
jgi:hypothetical protein